MNDPQTFPELHLPTLEKLAHVWGRRFPAIKSISLYLGVYYEYVLITEEVDEVVEGGPTYQEFREYMNVWGDPTCIHIHEDLLKLFKNGNSWEFLGKWFCWRRKPGEELPKELIVEKFSWHLYTKPGPQENTDSIPPVHPGELGRLKESALKTHVHKMVKVLGRFPITRVELHLFDRSSEDLRGDMSWINQNAKYALLFILRNEQNEDIDALLDRLNHHCITIRINGPSLRAASHDKGKTNNKS